MKKDDRVDAVQARQEIFNSDGTPGQVFTFTVVGAVYPNGLIEVAYRNSQTQWIDLALNKYILAVDGLSFSLVPGYSIPNGAQVRVIYTPLDGETVVIDPDDSGIVIFGAEDPDDPFNSEKAVKVDDEGQIFGHEVTEKTVEVIMNAQSVPALTGVETVTIPLTDGLGSLANVKAIALTIRVVFDPDATDGVSIDAVSSWDDTNYDTDYWTEDLEPAFAPGETHQVTHNIDSLPLYLRLRILNDDPAEPAIVTVVVTYLE